MKFLNIFKDPALRPIEVYGTIIGLLLVTYSFQETVTTHPIISINFPPLKHSLKKQKHHQQYF